MLPGPVKQPCPDGCGKFGVLTKGTGHVRGCPCPKCQGGRNRRRGMTAQRRFQKAAGIKQSAFRGANGNEESWRDEFRWEHKADLQNAKPVVNAYLRLKAQSEASRPIGDHRPFAAGLTHDGLQLVVVEAAVWARHRGEETE